MSEITNWCLKICERTGTSAKYFEEKLKMVNPRSETEAEAEMGKLLYQAWNSDYDSMWDKNAKNDMIT